MVAFSVSNLSAAISWHSSRVWAWAGAVAINISSTERVSPTKRPTPIPERTFDTIISFLN
jgi:hypothetical protein